MNHQIRALGLTLVELMAVVAIIALLAGIGGFFVMDNRPNRARTDLTNDIETLLHTQRMRATSMNVATYVRFEAGNSGEAYQRVVPRIGDVSVCVAEPQNQYSIRYSSDNSAGSNNNVAIDIKSTSKFRTLDSTDSSKYAYAGEEPIVRIDAKLFAMHSDDDKLSELAMDLEADTLVICFQPNGQAYFIDGTTFKDDARTARLGIRTNELTPETFIIEVTSLGAISTWSGLNLWIW